MEPIYSRTVPPCNYIRTSDFSLRDLSIFVDSMETIARIERERLERRQRRRNNKINKVKSTLVEVHPTPTRTLMNLVENREDSSEEEHITKKPVNAKQLRMKLFGNMDKNTLTVVASSSDENYFSGASEEYSEENNDQYSMETTTNDGIATLPPSDSGTESESCSAFKLRPRSFAMTTPKYRTTRARIIGLVLKREYANGGGDEFEQQERRERVLEGLLREKKKNKNSKCESLRLPSSTKLTTTMTTTTKEPIMKTPTLVTSSKSQKQPSAEMRFIDKALRYLTL
ncbi:uncharacterized protein LOC129913913 [Episyrphus balteatus]|uniref:uncharacterized protein LOC129913913 n=1 Tax=Episyrphus balteatus TaxID=286459 RepID=UPI0024865E2B|nr:uncharacterized protein LOC129913913 [Episyrphus balteatus]